MQRIYIDCQNKQKTSVQKSNVSIGLSLADSKHDVCSADLCRGWAGLSESALPVFEKLTFFWLWASTWPYCCFRFCWPKGASLLWRNAKQNWGRPQISMQTIECNTLWWATWEQRWLQHRVAGRRGCSWPEQTKEWCSDTCFSATRETLPHDEPSRHREWRSPRCIS